jgi:predicted dehydrogenase
MNLPHIGLIGCGRWGRNILRDLQAIGCRVTVADPDPEARQVAEGLGALTCLAGRELRALDGYVVATPTALHVGCILEVLDKGKPIFVEKPLSHDPEAARRLASRGGEIYVMEKWRYHPGVQALKAIAASGELGNVVGLRTTRVQWNQPHRDVDAAWILAPHDLSIAKEVLGKVPELRACVAERFREPGEGMLAVFGDAPWFVMEVSACHPETRREIRLVCERGIASLDDALAEHITIATRVALGEPMRTERRPIGKEMPLRRELEIFVGYLNGGPPPLTPLAEGVEMVELMARMRREAGLPR